MGCFQLKNVTPLTLGVALLATAGWVAAFARQNPIIRTVCRKLAQFFRLLIDTTLVLLIKWIPVLVCDMPHVGRFASRAIVQRQTHRSFRI